MSLNPRRSGRQPFVEETPEWIAEQAAKTGRSEEEILREVEKSAQRVEQRAEEVRARHEEEARRRQEEERRRQEDLERQRQLEIQKRRAEEERRRREEEERRRMEEEARRRAEEEARRRAEAVHRSLTSPMVERTEEWQAAYGAVAAVAERHGEAPQLPQAQPVRVAASAEPQPGAQPTPPPPPPGAEGRWARAAVDLAKMGVSRLETVKLLEGGGWIAVGATADGKPVVVEWKGGAPFVRVFERREDYEAYLKKLGVAAPPNPDELRGVEGLPVAVPPSAVAGYVADYLKGVRERLTSAVASRDLQTLISTLKELGVSSLPGELFGVRGEVAVEDLPRVLEERFRVSGAKVDEEAFWRLVRGYVLGGAAAGGRRFDWITPAIEKLRGAGVEVEVKPGHMEGAMATHKVYTVKMGGSYVQLENLNGDVRIAGAGYTKEYLDAVSSAIKNAVEAGDVERLERILKSLPPGVSTRSDLLKIAAEFYRDYVNRIRQLQQIIADDKAPMERKIEAARQMEALLGEAAEKYGMASAPSEDLYRLYQSFADFARNALENVRKFKESAEFAKAVADAFKGRERVDVVEALSRLAALTPPGGSIELRDEASKTSVVITGGGYSVLKIGGVPVFAVDKEGRVWQVDKSGAVLNVELPKDATGLVAKLVERGASPQEAYSAVRVLAELKTATESGQVSGSPFAVLAQLASRYGSIDLGEVKVLNEGGRLFAELGGRRFEIVGRGQHVVVDASGKPVASRDSILVKTDGGVATLEGALMLEEAKKKAAELSLSKSFAPDAKVVWIPLPVKYGDVIVGAFAAPVVEREVALPRLVEVGGQWAPYVTPEGELDRSHVFKITAVPVSPRELKITVAAPDGGSATFVARSEREAEDKVREAIASWYGRKYGMSAAALFAGGEGRATTREELAEFGKKLQDYLAGRGLGEWLAKAPVLSFLAGVLKGVGIADTAKFVLGLLPLRETKSWAAQWEAAEEALSKMSSAYAAGQATGFGAAALASAIATAGLGGAAVSAARGALAAGAGVRGAVAAGIRELGPTLPARLVHGVGLAGEVGTAIAGMGGALATIDAALRGGDVKRVGDEWVSIMMVPGLVSLGAGLAGAGLRAFKPGVFMPAPERMVRQMNEALIKYLEKPPEAYVDAWAKAFGLPLEERATVAERLRQIVSAVDKAARDPSKLSESEKFMIRDLAEGAKRLVEEAKLDIKSDLKPDPARVDADPLGEFAKAMLAVHAYGTERALKLDLYKIAERDPEKFVELYKLYKKSIEELSRKLSPEMVYDRVKQSLEKMGIPAEEADKLARQAAWGWGYGSAIAGRAIEEVFESLPPHLRGRIIEAAAVRYGVEMPKAVKTYDAEVAYRLLAERLGDEALAREVAGRLRNEQFISAYREFLERGLAPRGESAVRRVMARLKELGVKPEELEEVRAKAAKAEHVPGEAPREAPTIVHILLSRSPEEVFKDLDAALREERPLVELYRVPEPLAKKIATWWSNLSREAKMEVVKAYIEARGSASRFVEWLVKRGLTKEEAEAINAVAERLFTRAEKKPAVAEEKLGEAKEAAVVLPTSGLRFGRPFERMARAVEVVEEAPAGGPPRPRIAKTPAKIPEGVSERLEESGKAVAEARPATMVVARAEIRESEISEGEPGALVRLRRGSGEERRPLPLDKPAVIQWRDMSDLYKPSVSGIRVPIVRWGVARVPLWGYSLALPVASLWRVFEVELAGERYKIYIPQAELKELVYVVETPRQEYYVQTPTAIYRVDLATTTQPGGGPPPPEVPRAEVRPVHPVGGAPWWWSPISTYARQLYEMMRQRELLRI